MVSKVKQCFMKFLAKFCLNKPQEEILEDIDERIFVDDGNSWLNAEKIYITDQIYIRIPTVGEVLKNEQSYYGLIYALTSSPFQYMVQLDDMGLDYTKVTDYQLFQIMFTVLSNTNMSIIFGDLITKGYELYIDNTNDTNILYNESLGLDYKIDEFVYIKIADVLRKINNIKKDNSKPGNEEAKRYLVKKARKRQRRNANKPYEPYLEKMVVALVNRPEFKYNYEQVMDMSIYKFNQSFKQIETSITFDKTMIGVYAGTVDTSKMADKSSLSWIPVK